ncbi:MAG TPA: PHP-associated domain-containing protein [Chloroflexia bacterium]|nr:PHP-associated domain-containing protein [Chloroflexia bacterium]
MSHGVAPLVPEPVSAGPACRPAGHGKADLHIHSTYSDGIDSIPKILDYVEHRTDLDIIAIADHDDVRGAHEARELAARRGYRVQVIMGTEITTRQGHLLALFVERDFPMLKSLRASVDLVYEAGGLVIAPHPLCKLTASIQEKALLAVQASPAPFHGLETFNPSVAGRVSHTAVAALNARLGLPEFGGSDAHALSMIGLGYTYFPGATIADLRAALAAHTLIAGGRFMTFRDHAVIAAPNMWRSMVVSPAYKVQRAVRRSVRRAAS